MRVPGAEAWFGAGLNVRAKARTYLRSKNNGKTDSSDIPLKHRFVVAFVTALRLRKAYLSWVWSRICRTASATGHSHGELAFGSIRWFVKLEE